MAEFKEMFSHFDKDNNNQLEKHELKACLSSLGYSKTDAEIDAIVKDIAGGRNVSQREVALFFVLF
jgi:Ca2+-binding EF-hand superfamily protein